MKITIRVLNPYARTRPRPGPDVSPEKPVPPPKKAIPPPFKGNGGSDVSPAVSEAAAAAVARELKRLQAVSERSPSPVRPPAPVPAAVSKPRPVPPAARPASVPLPAAEETDFSPQPDFGLEDEPGLSAIQTRFKILIVDDDPIIVRLLTHFLSKSNYDVKSVTEGMEGLKIAFAEKPDLILLDVMMPGMDGFRFLELLKKGKRFANVPVLMISALVEEDQVLRALEAGATDYIVKPFSSRIVLAKVHKALKDLL
jgi:two-component system phosphate regulon response regulator PhoB